MGTTKTGRTLNTHGARGVASQFAVVHSNEGDYTHPQKGQKIRQKAGGHGQTGMNELDKYGIEYHVANLKGNRHGKDGEAVFGIWKGVRVGIIRTNGKIATIFPDSKQPYKKGGKKK